MKLIDALDQLIDDRDARIKARIQAQAAKALADEVERSEALALLDRAFGPALEAAADAVTAKGFQASMRKSTATVVPRAALSVLIPSQTANCSWPESTLEFVIGRDVTITWEVWGPKGKTSLPGGFPSKVSAAEISREWVDRQILAFLTAAINVI
ncbi:hypothetical protein LQF05_07820 [Stutzerimonas stutzeri]|uniref:hypothetical protein n=1 Tax=Stutzerimonas stutzeri TaxID=316 RepID=UPI0022DE74C7|nr:hypothetical protein [Stutzerimonas stutzeri]WBL61805.1 hypothetical protein LQF05_07820 [Stutzerimonas stutzeri]